jgi:hypothetical protein
MPLRDVHVETIPALAAPSPNLSRKCKHRKGKDPQGQEEEEEEEGVLLTMRRAKSPTRTLKNRGVRSSSIGGACTADCFDV